ATHFARRLSRSHDRVDEPGEQSWFGADLHAARTRRMERLDLHRYSVSVLCVDRRARYDAEFRASRGSGSGSRQAIPSYSETVRADLRRGALLERIPILPISSHANSWSAAAHR